MIGWATTAGHRSENSGDEPKGWVEVIPGSTSPLRAEGATVICGATPEGRDASNHGLGPIRPGIATEARGRQRAKVMSMSALEVLARSVRSPRPGGSVKLLLPFEVVALIS